MITESTGSGRVAGRPRLTILEVAFAVLLIAPYATWTTFLLLLIVTYATYPLVLILFLIRHHFDREHASPRVRRLFRGAGALLAVGWGLIISTKPWASHGIYLWPGWFRLLSAVLIIVPVPIWEFALWSIVHDEAG